MKTRTNLFKLFIALFGISFLLWNCEKESINFSQSIETKKAFLSKRINVENIPQIKEHLFSILKGKVRGKESENNTAEAYVITSAGSIPLENVIEIIDTIGNTKYTFPVIPKTYFENVFYNLVIATNTSDEINSYVLGYKMTAQFANDYRTGLKTINEYEGSIEKYTVEDFLASFNNNSRTSENDCQQLPVPDIPLCEDVSITPNGGNNSSSSGGGSGDVGNSPGGSTGTSTGSSGGWSTGSDSTGTSGSSSGSGGSGTTGGGSTTGTSCSFYTVDEPNLTYNDDCTCYSHDGTFTTILMINCGSDGLSTTNANRGSVENSGCNTDDDGIIAIEVVPFADLATTLDLTTQEEDCLESNCELKNEMYGFLNLNYQFDSNLAISYKPNAMNFANTVVDALVENNCSTTNFEVDFDDVIIYDASTTLCFRCFIRAS